MWKFIKEKMIWRLVLIVLTAFIIFGFWNITKMIYDKRVDETVWPGRIWAYYYDTETTQVISNIEFGLRRDGVVIWREIYTE